MGGIRGSKVLIKKNRGEGNGMNTYGFEIITADELKNYFNVTPEKDFILIDVRQPNEYVQTHIPGASLIPLPELKSKLSLLPKDKDLIFYCFSGDRSRMAAMTVADLQDYRKKPLYP